MGAGSPLQFKVHSTGSANHARRGTITTPHGSFQTPAFMPVATAAAMKGLTPSQVASTGSECILNNAYHLFLRPGHQRIARLGGVHSFMRWNGPILTDSGGFQAFSMAKINRLDEDGVTFASFVDGSKVHLGPESSMEVQQALGADIAMAFDDCPPASESIPADIRSRRMIEAKDRTLRWLKRCIAAHNREDQALFGIVQGGTDLALRTASAHETCAFDLPGYAIGGVAVGEGAQAIRDVVSHTAGLLPADRPRYLMGVGYPRDIVLAVSMGIDMFDCVLPTRNGRNGGAFTRTGGLRLRNAIHTDDPRPIEEDCDCQACAGGFSRAYLRHLFMAGEMLGPILVSLHNIRLFQRLVLDIRRAIEDDAWLRIADRWPCTAQANGQAQALTDENFTDGELDD